MPDYRNTTHRFVNMGINVRNDPDKLSEGQYIALTNVRSLTEGSLTTRLGRTLFIDAPPGTSSVHTIERFTPSFLLIGKSSVLYRDNILTAGGYSGNPLSIVILKPALSSTSWAYIGDSNVISTIKEDGTYAKWGITAPSTAASASAFGAGLLNSSVIGGSLYDWRYTYYNSSTGAESNPSPEMSTGVAVINQQASVSVIASSDAQVDTIRIYRRGGSQIDTWTLSVTSTNTTGLVTDNSSDQSIALALEIEEDNFVPFTSIDNSGNALYEVPLPYIWGPFLGKYILAAGDPNRPGHVYWTNAERPNSADVANNTPVSPPNEPLLSGFIYSSTPFVFSTSDLYALDFGGPTSVPKFVPRKTTCGKGLAAPWALAVGPFIYFLANDGIYATDGQSPAKSFSEEYISPIFNGVSVGDLEAVDFTATSKLRLYYADKKVHFLYRGTTTDQHLVFDTLYSRWTKEIITDSTWRESCIFQDTKVAPNSIYVGGSNGKVYTVGGTTDNGVAIVGHVKTGYMDFDMPNTQKEFGSAVLDINAHSNIVSVVTSLNTGLSALPVEQFGDGWRRKFPMDFTPSYTTPVDTFSYNIALDFTWSGVVDLYQYDVLWRPDEELLVHWEYPETSHGIPGWQHVRDIYLCYRAYKPITLTLTVDGVSHLFVEVFPATNGEKRKHHFYLPPIRGKVFSYRLDSQYQAPNDTYHPSQGSFRLYGEDCEVRVKPWNSSLGYSLISPFVAAQGGS